MNVRVTGQTQTANAIAYQQKGFSILAKYQDQIASGLRVKLPSDDPGRFPALADAKTASQRYAAYVQNMTDATTDLNAGVDALQETNNVLVRAKQIAIEGADGVANAQGHEALAQEVDALIERALKAGNSQQDGKYLFGGTGTDRPPFSVSATDASGRPATISYGGTADRSRALIAPGKTMDTKYAGNAVFQQAGTDVFAALIGLRDDLRGAAASGNAAPVAARLAEVDAARDAIGTVTAEQASSLAALEALRNRTGDLKLASEIRTSELSATDYAEAIVRMQEQQNSLEATLAISARIMQPNLLSFIG